MAKTAVAEVEVKVKSSDTRAFLAFVATTGKDEQGREVAPNGIKWKL